MTPVYFPFTHLCSRAAETLEDLFDAIALLRPFADPLPPGMRELEQRGFLKRLAPACGDEHPPEAAIRQLQEWGHRHAGGAGLSAAFWHERLAGGDPSAFELAARIKRRPPPERGPAEADRLQAARVFLHLAQELDRQDDEVSRELLRHDALNVRLMEGLTGRPGPGASQADGLRFSAREAYRLADRLSAWARLFRERECSRPVLVTTSAAVVEHLLQESTEARCVAPATVRGQERGLILELAQWAEAPADRLATLPPAAGGQRPEPARGGPIVVIFPGQTPRRFLGRLAGLEQGADGAAPGTSPGGHTLLVLASTTSG